MKKIMTIALTRNDACDLVMRARALPDSLRVRRQINQTGGPRFYDDGFS